MHDDGFVTRTVRAGVRVRRRDILDLAAYEVQRPVLRPALMRAKQVRQVLVGEALNFMFESLETVRYQIQEVLRAEGVTDELKIEREIETYNLLLGAPGELGCTLLVELGGENCASELEALVGLGSCLYLRMPDGRSVPARGSTEGTCERPSLVQFLNFDVRGVAPVAVGCSHPRLRAERSLSSTQRRTLERDLTRGMQSVEGHGAYGAVAAEPLIMTS